MAKRVALRKAGGGAKLIITGIEEVDRKLKSIEPNLQRKVIRAAMRKGMKVIEAEAKQNVPVDTGALRDSIKTAAPKKTKRGSISIQVRADEGFYQGATWYGGPVEYGTKRMPAHPFMAPAYDAKAEEAKQITMNAILVGIDKEVRAGSLLGKLDRLGKSKAVKGVRKAAKRGKKAAKRAAKAGKRTAKASKKFAKRTRKVVAKRVKQARKPKRRKRGR